MELLLDVVRAPFRVLLFLSYPFELLLEVVPPIVWAGGLATAALAGGAYARMGGAACPVWAGLLLAAVVGGLPVMARICRTVVGWRG